MSNDAKIPEGVALTTLTINAANPDVLGAVLKQITESVMKAIPEGTIEKIVSEVLKDGKILTQRTYNRYDGRHEEKFYELAPAAGATLQKLVEAEIERQVNQYFQTEDLKRMVGESVKEGMAAALAKFPEYAANAAMQRFTGVMMGDSHTIALDLNNTVPAIVDRLNRIQSALVAKGVLATYEIQ